MANSNLPDNDPYACTALQLNLRGGFRTPETCAELLHTLHELNCNVAALTETWGEPRDVPNQLRGSQLIADLVQTASAAASPSSAAPTRKPPNSTSTGSHRS